MKSQLSLKHNLSRIHSDLYLLWWWLFIDNLFLKNCFLGLMFLGLMACHVSPSTQYATISITKSIMPGLSVSSSILALRSLSLGPAHLLSRLLQFNSCAYSSHLFTEDGHRVVYTCNPNSYEVEIQVSQVKSWSGLYSQTMPQTHQTQLNTYRTQRKKSIPCQHLTCAANVLTNIRAA